MKKSSFTYGRQIALRTARLGGQTLGMLDTVRGNFIALRYKTKIEVEGVGEYQIEITNVVNTKTFKERQIVPSLMNMANI